MTVWVPAGPRQGGPGPRGTAGGGAAQPGGPGRGAAGGAAAGAAGGLPELEARAAPGLEAAEAGGVVGETGAEGRGREAILSLHFFWFFLKTHKKTKQFCIQVWTPRWRFVDACICQHRFCGVSLGTRIVCCSPTSQFLPSILCLFLENGKSCDRQIIVVHDFFCEPHQMLCSDVLIFFTFLATESK